MAEKLRAELEILTAKAEKDLKRFDRSLAGVERRITSMGGKGGKSLRPLGEGLSAATVNANEFEKSMAAANARVIAFGASAGLIMGVQRALKETVRATVQVEKSLADINVVLNANSRTLQQFGDSLFKVAGQTGQGFKTVATAATELARQGLSMEKTLLRTKDALILTRLTGMGAEEAVASLTAAVNSFNKSGITSAQVVNKMAKVDQAFAVSSDDLAKAISRVGSSAVDAGVSMDELLAITTAVQQRTARGGAVIGNAFKTIFTRIGRTDVQKKLAGIGVATRDMQGAMLPATKVLENLADKFQTLTQTQQNQIAESVAGVFQVNILRATLGDLASKYGVYNRAVRESASATDEAYKKNEQLNKTLDALTNKTLANLTKAGSAIGGATLQPAIENVLNLVNGAIGAFGKGGRFEEFGKGIGKDLLEGIGKFISGPGLVILTAGIIKLGASFAGFAFDALKGFAALGKEAANRKALEAQITAELQRQPNIIKQIERGELSAANAAKDMLAAMKASNLEATKLAATTSRISTSMMGMGALRRPGRAQGFIPNFADPNAERASAAMGGYKAGAIKNMNIPGQGSVMYNSAETVKRFPGMQQPAIMPPQGSRAGSNYQKAFGAAHGFDPYAASGFVPNFAIRPATDVFNKAMGNLKQDKVSGIESSVVSLRNRKEDGLADKLEEELARAKTRKAGAGSARTGAIEDKHETFNSLGTIGLLGLSGGRRNASANTGLDQIAIFRERSGMSLNDLKDYRVTFDTMQARSIDELKHGFSKTEFSTEISRALTDPVSKLSHQLFNKALGNDNDVSIKDLKSKFSQNTQLLPPGAEGSIFEAAINLGLLTTKTSTKTKARAFDQSAEGAQKPFDFEEVGPAKPDFKNIFGFKDSLVYADAKRTIDSSSLRSLIHKSYNRGIEGLPFMELLTGGGTVAKGAKKRKAALGHVPNFSPLGDAITRERAAGVPRSAIRVGASASLRSSGNPGGLGVYNTIDEPGGLGQGISRSRSMGINPKSHGVPNFQFRSTSNRAQTFRPHELSPVAEARERMGGKEGPKMVREGGKSIEKSAKTFDDATQGFTKATATLMGLSTMAYMAMPMMERAGMSEEATGKLSSLLMFSNIAAMVPRGGAGRGGFIDSAKRAGSSGMKSFTKGAAGRGFGAKLFDAVKGGGKAFGRGLVGSGKGGVARAGLSKLALPATIGLGAYDFATGAITGFKESPEEKALREAQEALQNAQQKDIRPKIEQILGSVSGFAGGFGTSSAKVRRQQFSDIRNMVFGESGLMTDADTEDQKKIASLYEDFTSTFTQGAGAVETGAEKFAKAMVKISESIAETTQKAAENARIQALNLRISQGDFAPKAGIANVTRDGLPMLSQTFGTGEDSMFGRYEHQQAGFSETQIKDAAGFIEGSMAGGKGGFQKRLLEDVNKFFEIDDKGKVVKRGQFRGEARQALSDIVGRRTAAAISGRNAFGLSGGELGFDERQANQPMLRRVPARGLAAKTTEELKKLEDQARAADKLPNTLEELLDFAVGGTGTRTGKGSIFGKYLGLSGDEAGTLDKMNPDLVKLALDSLGLPNIDVIKAGMIDPSKALSKTAPGGFADFAAAAMKGRFAQDDQLSFEQNRALNKINDKKLLVERQYLDALNASTNGLYAESDIKLREGKIAAENAFRDQANQIKEDVRKAEAARGIGVDKVLGDIRFKFTDQGRQDEVLAAAKEIIDADPSDLPFLRAQAEGVKADGVSTPARKQEAEFQLKIIALREKEIAAKETGNMLDGLNNDQRTTSLENAKRQNEIDRQIIKNKYIYNRGIEDQIANLELDLQRQKNAFLGSDISSGRIGGEGFRSARARERAMNRNLHGMAAAPTMGFGEVMEETFKYGPRDAAEEFEQGMADVALTVRDGLKDSIKSVITGAEDFKTALIGVFDKLLDKTLDTGLNMMINSLFSSFGNFAGSIGKNSQGGYIPRGYNQGGVVTGGSGVKDDVMTFMQGGEYVIKKSAAQKIGYSTLNSINSYASGGKARVSLAKDFLYTGDDPTRPTGGGFKVSRNLSSAAMFRDDDPQTGRMFGRQQTLTSYLEYRRAEQARRDAAIQRVKDQKKSRRNKAYISAAINIGMGAAMQARANTGSGTGSSPTVDADYEFNAAELEYTKGYEPGYFPGVKSNRGGSPALVMGGEYIMSPQTTAKYGTGFMSELNRGRLPGYQNGGMVGGGGRASSAITTNNVNLAINIDKSGQTSVEAQSTSGQGENQERQDKSEVEKQKQMGEAIRGVVLKEIERQQRPGGLLRDGASYAGGRRV